MDNWLISNSHYILPTRELMNWIFIVIVRSYRRWKFLATENQCFWPLLGHSYLMISDSLGPWTQKGFLPFVGWLKSSNCQKISPHREILSKPWIFLGLRATTVKCVTKHNKENNHIEDKVQLAYNTPALRTTVVHM